MEIASIIILIVSTVLLAGSFFLTFQIWLSVKEFKVTLPKFLEDLRNHNSQLKETIITSRSSLNENFTSSSNSLADKIIDHFNKAEEVIYKNQNNLNKIVQDGFEFLRENGQKSLNKNSEQILSAINSQEQSIKVLCTEIRNNYNNLLKAINEPLEL